MSLSPRELADDILHSCPEGFLATCEGDSPRVRPVSIAQVEGLVVRIASFSRWSKVEQIRANPKVELAFMDGRKRHLRITGLAVLRKEPEVRREVFDAFPLIGRYLPSPDHPDYTVIEVRPVTVRVKDAWELEYRDVPLP